MRGGSYGWQAAKKGYVFIGWTNTIGNMPAWGATDNRLGNNPLVIAIPFRDEAIVLDMAMSQYSFGAMELAEMKKEDFPYYGGYDVNGELTKDPSAIPAVAKTSPDRFLERSRALTYYWICLLRFYPGDGLLPKSAKEK